MIRLFVPQPLQPGAVVEPDVDQARYLTTVMRQQVGDEVLLFNGRDGEWRAALSEVGKRGCKLTLAEQRQKARDQYAPFINETVNILLDMIAAKAG